MRKIKLTADLCTKYPSRIREMMGLRDLIALYQEAILMTNMPHWYLREVKYEIAQRAKEEWGSKTAVRFNNPLAVEFSGQDIDISKILEDHNNDVRKKIEKIQSERESRQSGSFGDQSGFKL